MKKILIAGLIIFFGIQNSAYGFFTFWPSEYLDSKPELKKTSISVPPSADTLEATDFLKKPTVVELLKKQIEVQTEQLEKMMDINSAISGYVIGDRLTLPNNMDYFFQNPQVIYPIPRRHYHFSTHGIHSKIIDFMRDINNKENSYWSDSWIREKINRRLKYNGIVAKAVSLRAFQDVEKRFIQIADSLKQISNTKNVIESSELQLHIKNMLAMIKNESVKLKMVRDLSENEGNLINIQRRKLYGKMVDSSNRNIPFIRLSSSSL
ncbi:type IV secretion system protein [Bartonella tribocorum]|uniref:Uncharacterized protein n=1 Tax=Bartonella tribocorum TaxID=85701 RepID=A0A2N9Y7U5_9HYPH|nr:type IV secretion system protein [Bartonella tribocorum]PIT67778.1 hypothetical protein CER18_09630 [Bartonella tribocorum]